MVFSRFIWTILLLTGTIVATSVVLGIYLQKEEFPVTRSLLMILLAAETGVLVYTMTRIRRDLLKLVNALRNDDPTLQFRKGGKDPYFSAIHRGFNEIIRNFRLVRLDREAEQRFFEATVNHVGFGLIAFDREGKVEMVNAAFLKLFRLEAISDIGTLSETDGSLPGMLQGLSHMEELLKRITVNGVPCHLIFLASRFRIREKEINLVSVRDISREIDRNEMEAWQKLLRILRHEILNSLTPIRLISANLSETVTLENELDLPEPMTSEQKEALKTGLETIHRRSSSLSNFLDAYSNLYRIPEMEIGPVQVSKLLERTGALFSEQMQQEGITFNMDCSAEIPFIQMDEPLVEQALINLMKNALEAVSSRPLKHIDLVTYSSGGGPVICIRDTGSGIPAEQLDSIFIPFYSTRPDGSGIGLSFTQHIMRLHGGFVHVVSREGKGSEFQLHFPVSRDKSQIN